MFRLTFALYIVLLGVCVFSLHLCRMLLDCRHVCIDVVVIRDALFPYMLGVYTKTHPTCPVHPSSPPLPCALASGAPL